jgi:hypothetical protein
MNDDDDPIQGEDPGLPPYGNCTECGNGYAVHLLNAKGVCPRCLLTKVEARPNPVLPERR